MTLWQKMFVPVISLFGAYALVACGGGNSSDGGSDLSSSVMPDMTASHDGATPDLGPASLDGGSGDGGAPGYTSCGNVYVSGPQIPTISDACVACVTGKCCDLATACGANADCAALRTCFKTCGSINAKCDNACIGQYPNGQKDSGALTGCRTQKCTLECQNLSCLGKVVWIDPPVKNYTFKLGVVELQSGAMISGALVKVCAKSDATCANPLSMSTTGVDGSTMVTAPSAKDGIDGYLEVTATDMVPSIRYVRFADPVSALNGGSLLAPVLSKKTLAQFGGLLNVTIDPQRAGLLFVALDCTDSSAAGVTAAVDTADNKSVTAYIDGAIPSASAKATDSSGLGGILNLPVGSGTVTGKFPGGVQLSTETVFLRAGYFTAVNLVPSP